MSIFFYFDLTCDVIGEFEVNKIKCRLTTLAGLSNAVRILKIGAVVSEILIAPHHPMGRVIDRYTPVGRGLTLVSNTFPSFIQVKAVRGITRYLREKCPPINYQARPSVTFYARYLRKVERQANLLLWMCYEFKCAQALLLTETSLVDNAHCTASDMTYLHFWHSCTLCLVCMQDWGRLLYSGECADCWILSHSGV